MFCYRVKPVGGSTHSDAQIDTKVNYLDVALDLDEEGQIQYTLFRKENDSRQFPNTDTFHPVNVFDSVAFCQTLRMIHRNSQDETCVENMQDLKNELIECGPNEEKLDALEPKAVLHAT